MCCWKFKIIKAFASRIIPYVSMGALPQSKKEASENKTSQNTNAEEKMFTTSVVVPICNMLCLYVYGLQQSGQLNNSCPLCFLFCSVL